jgi:hypothetical protein
MNPIILPANIIDNYSVKMYYHPIRDKYHGIWVCVGKNKPEIVAERLENLFSLKIPDYAYFRFLIDPTQLHLILLANKFIPVNKIQACTPYELRNIEISSPNFALYYMRKNFLPSISGGWKTLTCHELELYQLTVDLQNINELGDEDNLNNIIERTKSLYLYKKLKFYIYDVYAFARVISSIIDIRRFSSPVHPDRLSYLQAYMGCDPFTLHSYMDYTKNSFHIKVQRGGPQRRLYWLLRTIIPPYYSNLKQIAGKKTLENSLLARIRWGGIKGIKKSCAVFLKYLTFVWRDMIFLKKDKWFIPKLLLPKSDLEKCPDFLEPNGTTT